MPVDGVVALDCRMSYFSTEDLAAADVIDALDGRFNHRSHLNGLVGPDKNKAMIGPALTISFMPVRDDLMNATGSHNLGPALYNAIGDAEAEGAVLVMASNGHYDSALGGGTKLSRLHNLNMAGVVCDGRLRDFEELADYSFSAYCTGETVKAGGKEVLPYLCNVPVVLGGVVTVNPGDMIYADDSGVAVVPPEHAEEIFADARVRRQRDRDMLPMIAAENPADVLAQGVKEV